MKKYIYMICALLTGALASCSQNESATDESNPLQKVTLQVGAEQNLNTRAVDASVDRFAIEVYTDATYETAANVFDNTNKATSATGSFSMVLDRTQKYYCLLWADKSGAANYDVTSLKAVSLKEGKNPVEAWHGTLTIEAGTAATLSATLHRAVAKISMLETGLINANSSLALTFKQRTTFDVSSAATTTDEADRTETITITDKVEGTPSTPIKLNDSDVFVLASAETADQLTLAFQMGTDPKIEVSNVPLKANHNTNVKGHYSSLIIQSFTVDCEDAWETPDNGAEVPGGPVDYIRVNGIKVAAGNLVADGANGAKIGEPTDIGLYFQFGSLIGWRSESDGPVMTIKPTGCIITNWNREWEGDTAVEDAVNGKGDPCKYYLKSTWRLPTKDEYLALFNNSTNLASATSWSTAESGSVTHITTGLTFIAVGYLDGDGRISDVGSGYYWSATKKGDETPRSHNLAFGKSNNYLSPASYNFLPMAMPIRCVRN